MNQATHIPADPSEAKKLRATLRAIHGLQRTGVTLAEARAGDSGSIGAVRWKILAPDFSQLLHAQTIVDANHASVVIKLTVSAFNALVSADADAASWEAVCLRGSDLTAHVLQIPHHGAAMGTSSGDMSLTKLLDTVRAKTHVVSVGSINGYGHPAGSVLATLQTYSGSTDLMCTQLNSVCAGCRVNADTSCAGTVKFVITDAGVQITPDPAAHRTSVSTLPNAQCV